MINKKLTEMKKRKTKMWFIWLFPTIFIWQVIIGLFKAPIRKRGIHAILQETGGGKTITAHLLDKEILKKGWTVYSNSKFNDYMKPFDLEEYFGGGEQLKPLTNCILILDEIQHDFNRRMNRQKDYNDIFMPFIKMLTTHRHDNIVKVYFLTQAWEQLDIQLQRLIHRVHIVKARQYPSLYEWLRRKSWRTNFRPTSVKVHSFRKSAFQLSDYEKYIDKKGDMKYKRPKKYSISIRIKDLVDFQTHAFKNKAYGKSSVDKKKEKK